MQAQVYEDYVGAGHFSGVTVSSSADNPMNMNNTANGAGLGVDEYAAVRFFRLCLPLNKANIA